MVGDRSSVSNNSLATWPTSAPTPLDRPNAGSPMSPLMSWRALQRASERSAAELLTDNHQIEPSHTCYLDAHAGLARLYSVEYRQRNEVRVPAQNRAKTDQAGSWVVGEGLALERVEDMLLQANPTPMPRMIGKTIDLVVCLQSEHGVRRVTQVASVHGWDGHSYQTKQEA